MPKQCFESDVLTSRWYKKNVYQKRTRTAKMIILGTSIVALIITMILFPNAQAGAALAGRSYQPYECIFLYIDAFFVNLVWMIPTCLYFSKRNVSKILASDTPESNMLWDF